MNKKFLSISLVATLACLTFSLALVAAASTVKEETVEEKASCSSLCCPTLHRR